MSNMEIFKSSTEHDALCHDLKLVYTCFNDVKLRIAEKTLDNLIDRIIEEMHLNITPRAAHEVSRLEEKYPDEDFVTLVDFLVWKQDFKVISSEEFDPNVDLYISAPQVRVYKDNFYIEISSNGVHSLTVENSSWSEPETSLEEMEFHLFKFYRLNKENE